MAVRSSWVPGVAAAVTLVVGTWLGALISAQERAGPPPPEVGARKAPMTVLSLRTGIESGPDKQVDPVFTGPRRRLVQITLRNQATLDAHKAPVPITIQCIAGSGTLTLPGQDTTLSLTPGVLVTIEPDVVHEIVASPSVSVLLTQFTSP